MTKDTIEQALSYARHPEVAAVYAAILNGKHFLLFRSNQRFDEKPLVDTKVTSPYSLALMLEPVLSPPAIKKDHRPLIIDLERPLATGFRSTIQVTGGMISNNSSSWETNLDLPDEFSALLDKTCKKLEGIRSTIHGGRAWRDASSRVRVALNWHVPHTEMLPFVDKNKLQETEYVSAESSLSENILRPIIFEITGNFSIQEGEEIYDILRWDSMMAEIETQMTYFGQATGYVEDKRFKGIFFSEYRATFPVLPPHIYMSVYTAGSVQVDLAEG